MSLKDTFVLALLFSILPIVHAGDPHASVCPGALVAHESQYEADFQDLGRLPSNKQAPIQSLSERAQLRRLWLDLTGRVPSPEIADAYVNNTSANKWDAMVDQILASEAYTERWATFFDDLFWNHNILGNGTLRNNFHENMRKSVADDLPLTDLCKELITARGQNGAPGSVNFFYFRQAADEPFRLDYLDDQLGFITESMLGVQTTCISCHDGAYHLEQVNKGLSKMTRQQFWGMAAFLSKGYFYVDFDVLGSQNSDLIYKQMRIIDLELESFNRRYGLLVFADRGNNNGEYEAISMAGDGMRPPRNGGLIQPAYFTDGGGPREGETRREALARMLTSDRQFARNFVNRVWAHFMGKGFVDPVNGWDLGRLNVQIATDNESTVQAQTPKLMEWLTDRFIAGQFSLKRLIKTIVTGPAYRLDSEPDNEGWPGAEVWRLQRQPRRLEAEAVVDAFFGIHGLQAKYLAVGYDNRTFKSAWELPGPTEPNPNAIYINGGGRRDNPLDVRDFGFRNIEEYNFYLYVTQDMQTRFDRGDYYSEIPRSNKPSVQNALALLNHEAWNFWLGDGLTTPFIQTMVQAMDTYPREAVVTEMFRRILFRDPSSEELTWVVAFGEARTGKQLVQDLAWSLFNHPDFIYR